MTTIEFYEGTSDHFMVRLDADHYDKSLRACVELQPIETP